jgi:anthranilate synthase component II
MKVLVFDNYDSFTYNLVHLIAKEPGVAVTVKRNDEIALEDIGAFDKIVLSPGPGIPAEAGLLLPLIAAYAPMKPILGVCLGHQAIGESFGGNLVNLTQVYHGVATPITHLNKSYLFKGLSATITVGRYHSWVISENNFPTELVITATDDNGFVMGLQHTKYDIQGVQFHPESVLTPDGETMIKNWLAY